MDHDDGLFMLGFLLFGVLLGGGMMYQQHPVLDGKEECEQSLPRDIECVWSAPVMAEGEGYETENPK